MPAVTDYYETLGLARDASEKDIKSAFRKLARKHHPDANPGDVDAERRFKAISEANDVLSDPEKRRLYDRFGSNWEAASQGGGWAPGGASGAYGPNVQYQTIDPEEFERLFGGAGGAGLGDLFGSIFEGQGGTSTRRGRASTRPAEAEGDVEITLREAFTGTARQVVLPDGRRIEVQVPAGVADGTILRVPGLRARVHVAPDTRFRREGTNLSVTVEVPLRVALLGGEVEVPTLKGGRVRLTVPAETQNGTRLRLRGLGFPGGSGGKAGDLFAQVDVRLPLPLTEAARNLAEGLAP
ncbi:MAG: J domain-containing protein [Candidatus Dormibacteraeota bacterium]|nr:J domain-containing protein [Candidatus Dormibacteraeota bacterium]